jgi:hypothetical protein
MPLGLILQGRAKRCAARSKRTSEQCWALAAYQTTVCYHHGARKPGSAPSGPEHWRYSTGQETRLARQERSRRLAELRDLEALMLALGELNGPRWRGRHPKRQG